MPHWVCVILHPPQEVLLFTLTSVHLRAPVHPNVSTGRVGSTQAARKKKQNSDQHRTTVKSHRRTEVELITSTELTTNNEAVNPPLCREAHELLVLWQEILGSHAKPGFDFGNRYTHKPSCGREMKTG